MCQVVSATSDKLYWEGRGRVCILLYSRNIYTSSIATMHTHTQSEFAIGGRFCLQFEWLSSLTSYRSPCPTCTVESTVMQRRLVSCTLVRWARCWRTWRVRVQVWPPSSTRPCPAVPDKSYHPTTTTGESTSEETVNIWEGSLIHWTWSVFNNNFLPSIHKACQPNKPSVQNFLGMGRLQKLRCDCPKLFPPSLECYSIVWGKHWNPCQLCFNYW